MLTLVQNAWWWLQHPACLMSCLKSSMELDGNTMLADQTERCEP
jgi:hypothetical protein